MKNSIMSLAFLIAVLSSLGTANSEIVTAISSSLYGSSVIGSISDTESTNQGSEINALSVSTSRASEGLTMDVDGSAIFTSPSTLSVGMVLSRSEKNNPGYDGNYGGDGTFIYNFHVDDATTVTIDYDILTTSTWAGSFNPYVWSGITPYQIEIDGNLTSLGGYSIFDPAKSSPYAISGAIVSNLGIGNHTIRIHDNQNGYGSIFGDREKSGLFEIQIGVSVAVPEPSSLITLAGALTTCVGFRRQKRRILAI